MRYNSSKFYKNESNKNHVTAGSRAKDSKKHKSEHVATISESTVATEVVMRVE